MDIQTTVEIIPICKEEKIKDKTYWLKCYRIKQAIQNLNRICIKIVNGELYPDDNFYAVVDGFRWI